MGKCRRTIILSAFILGAWINTNAMANTASLFSKFSGEFRGSGTSVTGTDGKKRRISCQLTNTYDPKPGNKSSGNLKMRGKCASSKGSSLVKGTLSHIGSKVSGTYISLRSNVKMTSSSGKAGKRSMTILSAFVERGNGKLIKLRQVLQLTRGGFQANFSTFDNKTKKYEPVGIISFKRK